MSRQPSLIDALGAIDATRFGQQVESLAQFIGHSRAQVVALLADNGVDWLAADRAVRSAGRVLLPLPTFFTDAQCRHALDAAGVCALLTDQAARAERMGFGPLPDMPLPVPGTALSMRVRDHDPAALLPAATAKITFTSGTTGKPKGVCLSQAQLSAVTASLTDIALQLGIRRHLCMLPLAVLLENVAGADVAWQAGAECVAVPLREVGLAGSSQFDVRTALSALERWQPESIILLPQMLTALVAAAEAGAPIPGSLKLVAVGGARVSADLIARARALGIPACEGYGLSEAGSVVALNLPTDPPGTVGRVLPHLRADIAADGEILLHGSRLPGYVGAPAPEEGPLHTGDIGHVDADGRLRVTGRIKHQIITSFGRNVAPEWPEAELLATPAVAQVVVFGEAQPSLSAVIVPRGAVPDSVLEAAVQAVNRRLPDYARIGGWLRADAPFSAANGQATDNGRVRRDQVWAFYGDRFTAHSTHFSGETPDVLL